MLACWRPGQHAFILLERVVSGKRASREFPPSASRQAEKSTASRDQTRQSRTDDGTRSTSKPGVAGISALGHVQSHVRDELIRRRGD